jgi:hypothetical protein
MTATEKKGSQEELVKFIVPFEAWPPTLISKNTYFPNGNKP